MDEENNGSGGGLLSFVQMHPVVLLGLGAVVVFILVSRALKSGNTAVSSATTADSTQHTLYVPTSTNFYTDNSQNAISAEGAPASIGPVNSPVSTSATTSTSTTTTNPPPIAIFPPVTPPVVTPPPRSTPPPPVKHKGAIEWNQRYTVVGGDNLSRIASNYTAKLRNAGAPSSVSVGWHDIYAHNQSVIDNTARQHGVSVNPYNYIYPGESLTVPRWNKDAN